jgi:hypothetical protein
VAPPRRVRQALSGNVVDPAAARDSSDHEMAFFCLITESSASFREA